MASNLTYAYAYVIALIDDGMDFDNSMAVAAESYNVDQADLRGLYADGTEADTAHF